MHGVAAGVQVQNYIAQRYPGRWKASTISAHLYGGSINNPKAYEHHRSMPKFLFASGRGRYEIYDPAKHGSWPKAHGFAAEAARGWAKPSAKLERPAPRGSTLGRMIERVERLCAGFGSYLEFFDQSNRFSGPSLYFHFRTLDQLRAHQAFTEVFDDRAFFEYLYATLTSWGLHRMGPGGTKLVDFEALVESIRAEQAAIARLQPLRLVDLTESDAVKTAETLWQVMENIKVSASQTKLVASSKALHHLLPRLVPPIDRQYTLQFFYNTKMISGTEEEVFRTIYGWFVAIGRRTRTEIEGYLGRGFHTSETKTIDNAIVGFVLKELQALQLRGPPRQPMESGLLGADMP